MRCEPTCVICLGGLEVGQAVRLFTCKHGYHAECIDEWLVRRRVCPLCVSVVSVPVSAVPEAVELAVVSV